MPYRYDMFSQPSSKNINLSYEHNLPSGLIVPRPLAIIHISEQSGERMHGSFVIPSAAETTIVNMDSSPSYKNLLPETSFLEEELKLFSIRAMERMKQVLNTMNQVSVRGAITKDASLVEKDELDDIQRQLEKELKQKDDRPVPGFYM